MSVARRIATFLSIAVLGTLGIATPVFARQDSADGQSLTSGSARLVGRVVAADNGRPVRRVPVKLSRLNNPQGDGRPNHVVFSWTVETDTSGRFDVANLPSGLYSIAIDPASGFVQLTRTRYAVLTESQTVEMTVRLERAGAIEGNIQDENGDRMPGVQVQAVRRFKSGSLEALGTSGASGVTNDLGEYRLFNVPAGEYYVAAHAASRGTVDPPLRPGYADTYYPGAGKLQRAKTVVVRAGRDSKRVNVKLAPCRLALVSIHPVDSHGVALGRAAQFALTKRGPDVRWATTRPSRREDGTAVFAGVAPGEYELLVTTSAQMEEAAYAPVTVDQEDVSLSVRTNTGARVSGRVILDGRPLGDDGSASANVLVAAFPPSGKYGPGYAQPPLAHVRGTDRFELKGLRGPMVLSGEVGLGALLSIQYRGEEISGKTLEFAGTEGLDDVVVELTTKVARVDVTVTSSSARTEPEPVLVVLFSEDPTRWRHGYLQYARITAPSKSAATADAFSSGKIELIRMPPGRYLIAAIHDVPYTRPTEVSMLETLRPLAVPITLVAGQTTAVALGVTSGGR